MYHWVSCNRDTDWVLPMLIKEDIVFFANSAEAISDLPQDCLPNIKAIHEISEFINYFDEHRVYSYYRD